jgi:hypothetical protein
LFGYLKNAFASKEDLPEEYRERLNWYQIGVLLIVAVLLLFWIF